MPPGRAAARATAIEQCRCQQRLPRRHRLRWGTRRQPLPRTL